MWVCVPNIRPAGEGWRVGEGGGRRKQKGAASQGLHCAVSHGLSTPPPPFPSLLNPPLQEKRKTKRRAESCGEGGEGGREGG